MKSWMQKSHDARSEPATSGMACALHDLFLDELAELYSAEKQIIKTLPALIKASHSEELRKALEVHLKETEIHAARLEKAAKSLGTTLAQTNCKGMQGILEDGCDTLKEQKNKPCLDATLIAAAQKVEHYEIASYGAVCAWGREIGHEEAVSLLEVTENEEKAADETLTEIAESLANAKG